MYLDYDQLSAFAAVLREGSFDRAARVLHVTPSAISQRVKQLEETVGGVLVVRGTPCTATAVGQAIHRHALQVELLEKDLLASIAPREPEGAGAPAPMTVVANADSLATWVVPALARFAEETGARVEIVVDDQDYSAEWLRSGRVLGAVTAEARPVQGCSVQPLGVMRYLATASPGFVRRWFPKGLTAEALRRAPALVFNRKDELQLRFARRVLRSRAVQLPTHSVPSPNAFVEACLLGLGWGMNPERLIEAHLKSRRLVALAADGAVDVPLYWQQWRLASRTLDTLASALRTEAAVSLRAR